MAIQVAVCMHCGVYFDYMTSEVLNTGQIEAAEHRAIAGYCSKCLEHFPIDVVLETMKA